MNTKDSAIEYKSIQNKLLKFNIDSFCDAEKIQQYVELFSIKKICQSLEADKISTNNNDLERSVSAFEEKPYEPEYDDLCRLHYIALSRKCLNVLEFGSGFSTAILADAMRILKKVLLITQLKIFVQTSHFMFFLQKKSKDFQKSRKIGLVRSYPLLLLLVEVQLK